jgi:O-antigen/teichoic acid export membrane protein
MNHFTTLINTVAFPAFSSIQDDPIKAGTHFLKAVRLMGLIAFPALWGLSSISPELFAVMLGAKWSLGTELFRFICLAVPFLMISSMMSYAVLGMGRPKVHFSITFVAALVMPVTILVAVQWGLIGVSLAWAVIYPLVFIFNLSQVVKVFGLTVMRVGKDMAKPVFTTLVMYGVVSAFSFSLSPQTASAGHLVFFIIIGVLAYGGLVMTLNRDGFHEVRSLMQR